MRLPTSDSHRGRSESEYVQSQNHRNSSSQQRHNPRAPFDDGDPSVLPGHPVVPIVVSDPLHPTSQVACTEHRSRHVGDFQGHLCTAVDLAVVHRVRGGDGRRHKCRGVGGDRLGPEGMRHLMDEIPSGAGNGADTTTAVVTCR